MWIPYLIPSFSSRGHVDGLVIVQIPDAGVCPVLQEQLDHLLLVLVPRQSSCHVKGCVAMGLKQREGEKKE